MHFQPPVKAPKHIATADPSVSDTDPGWPPAHEATGPAWQPSRRKAAGGKIRVRHATPSDVSALTDLLVRIRDDFGDPPILITENGAVFAEPLHDEPRIRFIHDHLAALANALEQGVNVLGYCHWSFMDNFEWALGYAQRFPSNPAGRRRVARSRVGLFSCSPSSSRRGRRLSWGDRQ